jgi:hypothetical protein
VTLITSVKQTPLALSKDVSLHVPSSNSSSHSSSQGRTLQGRVLDNPLSIARVSVSSLGAVILSDLIKVLGPLNFILPNSAIDSPSEDFLVIFS